MAVGRICEAEDIALLMRGRGEGRYCACASCEFVMLPVIVGTFLGMLCLKVTCPQACLHTSQGYPTCFAPHGCCWYHTTSQGARQRRVHQPKHDDTIIDYHRNLMQIHMVLMP